MSKPETVGAGVVASTQQGVHYDDDELLVSTGGQRAMGIRKTYQPVKQSRRVSSDFRSRYALLSELKEQTTAIMETVVFSVFLGFNLLCLFIGIICWNEGLGTLWIELDDKYESEYDFGWRKASTHRHDNHIEFNHKNVYDTDLEAAGEFFVLITSVGTMMILSLLIVRLLDACCECCNKQKKMIQERNMNEETESWDAFLFIMSVWYGIFQVIYFIAIVAFNGEFNEACSDWVEKLEEELSDDSGNINYEITQYECVEGWGMYFQYLNLILGFTNVILLCQIRKSVNVANEIRKAQGPPGGDDNNINSDSNVPRQELIYENDHTI